MTEAGVEAPAQANENKVLTCSNIQVLRNNDVRSLFHFTDASNLESISKHGLLTWKKLGEQQIAARMNSSELSHRLDTKAGLADFVRLSFCEKHPMMYLALKDGRISKPVVLEIKLEVVSRPGVLFCAINAASSAAKASEDPSVIHFETVRANSQRSVAASERVFFQGEVLVPDCIPPHLIKIPKVGARARPLEFRGRLPDSSLVVCTLGSEIGVKDSKPSSLPFHQTVALEQGSSAPEPLVSLLDVHSAGIGKSIHETFVAPKKVLRTLRVKWPKPASKVLNPRAVVGWSNLRKAQEERKQKLADLVAPDFMPWCEVLGYDEVKAFKYLLGPPPPLEVRKPARGCEMPLTVRTSCADCVELGPRMNCPLGHMRICGAPIWVSCDQVVGGCDRVLCWEHMPVEQKFKCYCKSARVGIGGAAVRESEKERKREVVRQREEREREREWGRV